MPAHPHIVVVMADQFRASALGLLGEDPVSTPHLDRLAREGRLVRHAVSSYPVCSPHRAMFLTGLRPVDNGVTLNVNSETGADGVGLRDGLPTWASVLRAHGYRTGYIGKWHLEPPTPDDETHGEGRRPDGKVWDAWSPPARRFGFDFWYSYGAADRHLAPHYWHGDAERGERIDVDQWSAEHEIDIAIDFIRGHSADASPFALMVSLNPPHQPFDQVPEQYRALYADVDGADLLTRPNVPHDAAPGSAEAAAVDEAASVAADYFAAVSGVDAEIGRLVAALDDLRDASDPDSPAPILVFTSDHGMQLGSHGLLYKNVGYEESMRIPLIVHSPGLLPAQESGELIDSLGFAPTLLGLAGLAHAIPPQMVGQDSSAALRGEAPESADPAALYYRYPSRSDHSSARGIRTRIDKLITTWEPTTGLRVEYYDLTSDPFEARNAADSAAAGLLAQRLIAALDATDDDFEGADALRALSPVIS
ncbi:arylsulfatase A-like enzyme [Microbacterium keratanolyticum]|uniref:Sulfatase n=1 Tax=Microbacterium keratanolyticum TaxID=67574 RepID=A0A9W6M8K4_9MICO|nr:sulfatase [Microbacterium keratanolyticum]MBM7469261.1 arylsulfatase A-like enzyme [Microbacterium keratanolyticum]GLK01341.1 sulfatase [Microbacterium keratanolyticum]